MLPFRRQVWVNTIKMQVALKKIFSKRYILTVAKFQHKDGLIKQDFEQEFSTIENFNLALPWRKTKS